MLTESDKPYSNLTIVNKSNFDSVIKSLHKESIITLDTETNGFNTYSGDRIGGIGILTHESDQAFYFPYRHKPPKETTIFDIPIENLDIKTMKILNDKILKNLDTILMFNAKFDVTMFLADVPAFKIDNVLDVMLIYVLTGRDTYHTLAGLTRKYLQKDDTVDRMRFDKILNKYKLKNKIEDYTQIPVDLLANYNTEDLYNTKDLYYLKTEEDIKALQPALGYEHHLIMPLIDMEAVGLTLDLEYCQKAIDLCEKRVRDIKSNLIDTIGDINFKSNDEVGRALNDQGIEVSFTDKGSYSITDDFLEELGKTLPIAKSLVQYRFYNKMKATYFDNYLDVSISGRLHQNIRANGTKTGRFTVVNPALQTLPKFRFLKRKLVNAKDEVNVKKVFVPKDGFKYVFFDYVQMELVFMIAYARDKHLIKMVKDGVDIHAHMAELLFDCTKDHPKFDLYRDVTKTINFAIIYGAGILKIMEQLNYPNINMGVDESQTKKIRDRYYRTFPGIKRLNLAIQDRLTKKGFIHTPGNRFYTLDMNEPPYKYLNYLIQGGCAEMVKQKLIESANYLKKKKVKSHIVLQVHDELVFEIHETEHRFIREIKSIMEDFPAFLLPMRVDVEISDDSLYDKRELTPNDYK